MLGLCDKLKLQEILRNEFHNTKGDEAAKNIIRIAKNAGAYPEFIEELENCLK
jgi:hypothetical protein